MSFAFPSPSFHSHHPLQVREYDGHAAAVRALMPFGQHLVTLAEDNVVRVFDVESGGERAGA